MTAALHTGEPAILDAEDSGAFDAARALFVPWADEAGASGACVVIGSGRGSGDSPSLDHLAQVIPERIVMAIGLARLEARVAELEQTADAFRALVEATSDPVKVIDLDGRVRMWNAACEELYGYTAQEVIGEVLPHVPRDDRARWIAEMRSGVALGVTQERDVTGMRKDGSLVRTNMACIALHDDAGLPVGALSVARRIDADSRLEQMQSDFLSLVTQELKNPLTAIMGLTQMLSRPEFRDDPVKRARTTHALEARAAELSAVVDELLLASRVERGGLKPTCAPTDLTGLVAHAVSRFEHSARERRIVLGVAPEPLVGDVDGRRIVQAVTHLLENAAKHSPPEGEIRIEVARDGAFATIAVSDDGEGVPPEELERVFDRFYKVPAEQRDPGTGLGLYLVRSIAEAHGGTITVVSKPGQGATFTMRIPLTA